MRCLYLCCAAVAISVCEVSNMVYECSVGTFVWQIGGVPLPQRSLLYGSVGWHTKVMVSVIVAAIRTNRCTAVVAQANVQKQPQAAVIQTTDGKFRSVCVIM